MYIISNGITGPCELFDERPNEIQLKQEAYVGRY